MAHYAQRHGDIPVPNLLELVGVVELTDQQAKPLRDVGMAESSATLQVAQREKTKDGH